VFRKLCGLKYGRPAATKASRNIERTGEQLRSIQTFKQLIPFLEEDLDWPFPHGAKEYEFESLTFEYTPEELGLGDEYSDRIKSIRQLRPLVSGQPWGIFFVEFDNKKLPVVVLRRILSHLVIKKRQSANPAESARWRTGDLLFISAFAEEGTPSDGHFVVVLDPATGTATFLVEVIDVIYRTMHAKWTKQRVRPSQQKEAWNAYVPHNLLPRLFGYELMMAPYPIAHMKIGLKLHETGYTFGSDARVRIYLTNALERPRQSEVQEVFA
jgi:hypothetical protein